MACYWSVNFTVSFILGVRCATVIPFASYGSAIIAWTQKTLHPLYLLHLHLGFRVASGFILFSRLTHLQMPYAVSVRQVSGLPPASFRSRLAADTLALGYVLGATPCTRNFHPLERAHAERTDKRAGNSAGSRVASG